MCFYVSSTEEFIKGPDKIMVLPNRKETYYFQIHPIKRGEFKGVITFKPGEWPIKLVYDFQNSFQINISHNLLHCVKTCHKKGHRQRWRRDGSKCVRSTSAVYYLVYIRHKSPTIATTIGRWIRRIYFCMLNIYQKHTLHLFNINHYKTIRIRRLYAYHCQIHYRRGSNSTYSRMEFHI